MWQQSPKISLVPDASDVRFHVFDVYHDLVDGKLAFVERQLFTDANAASLVTAPSAHVRTRVISIRANASELPLQITQRWLSIIIAQYQVEDEFRYIIDRFGTAPQPAEGGCTQAFAKQYSTGTQVCGYNIQYMDNNGRGGSHPHANPWSKRHIGIYHRQVPTDPDKVMNSFNLIIALHSSQGTNFARQLFEMSQPVHDRGKSLGYTECQLARRLHSNSASIHAILLETLHCSWTSYQQGASQDFQRRLDSIFTVNPDIKNAADDVLGFSQVQQFRRLRDTVLTAIAFCRGQRHILALLSENGITTDKTFTDRAIGCLSGLDSLQRRIENSIDLLEYTVDYRHQEIAKESNRQMKRLGIITTVLGLIYVPASFVSGLFGMNFFNYDSDSNELTIASNTWILVPALVAFSGLTCGAWMLAEMRKRGGPRFNKKRSQRSMCSVGELC